MAADRGRRSPASAWLAAKAWTARRGTVRVRTTLGATLVVAVALAVGGWGLVTVLKASLVRDLTTAAQLRADDVAKLLQSGHAPRIDSTDAGDSSLVQIVDPASGTVIASSANLAGEPAVLTRPLARPSTRSRLPAGEGEFRVVTVVVATPSGRFLVVVARSFGPVHESVRQVSTLLLEGLPVLVLLVAGVTWAVTRRALRPVEAMRREAESISSSALDRRMPLPAGHDEVARLAHTMNAMLDRLEQGRIRQQQFVSEASHELRSPLATIRHQLEVAQAHPGEYTVAALAVGVEPEAKRMADLIDNLLTLARLDERPDAATDRPVDLDDLVFVEADRLRRHGKVFVDTGAVSGGRCGGEATALSQAIRNLADNAERHAATRVRFELATDESTVTLVVADDGPGIPPGQEEQIFRRFWRLDESRTRTEGGAGLGLAITAAVVAAHHGSIEVRNEPNGGARFEIKLRARN